MLVVVFAGSAIALIAMCRLWDIRKYSSQNFQPRIRIYMYRRLTFIVSYVSVKLRCELCLPWSDQSCSVLPFFCSYAAEIIVLLLVWFVFHFTHQQSTASFIVSKAVVCSSGILLIVGSLALDSIDLYLVHSRSHHSVAVLAVVLSFFVSVRSIRFTRSMLLMPVQSNV